MNAVTTTEPVSAQTLEHVLGTGDLSKLSTQQRVEYYAKTCQSLGLNPLTRPMRFLALNGQIQLYFTRDGTDQIRQARGITLHVVDKMIDAGLFTVTVRARTKDGREDEDIGAVVLPTSGESRANALMKAMTKAKRRVTLSICGLGQTDESELDTMPGAQVFDAEDELPVAPIRAAAAPMPPAERKVDPTVYETPAAPEKRTWAQWKDALELAVKDARTPEERGRLLAKAEVTEIVRLARLGPYSPAKARIIELYEEVENRYLADPPDPPNELPEVEIAGSEKMASG
ncbi:MAG TPA: hypothetical protein VJO13_06230 [Ktedonobacterales bacterium]|nr:hypothetical protein [Ktedonobacterales bacterium]